jgi:hypothetical protein
MLRPEALGIALCRAIDVGLTIAAAESIPSVGAWKPILYVVVIAVV